MAGRIILGTKNQLCIIHQVRNSCKLVPYKDRKAVCVDLKKIYGAVNPDDAVRKFTKAKAIFPTDDSIRKAICMSTKEISRKRTMPVRDWGLAYAQFLIFFEDRFAA